MSVFTKECCILRSEFDIQKMNVVFVNEFFVSEFDIWVIATVFNLSNIKLMSDGLAILECR